jgi:hypothetical protein
LTVYQHVSFVQEEVPVETYIRTIERDCRQKFIFAVEAAISSHILPNKFYFFDVRATVILLVRQLARRVN